MDATPHIIESALLLLAAFLIGCVIGYFIRRISGVRSAAPAAPAAPAVAATADAPIPEPTHVQEQPAVHEPEAVAASAAVAEVAPVKPSRRPRSAASNASTAPRAATAKSVAQSKPKKSETPDDLQKIKGIGPRLEAMLKEHGITRYAQIAKWSTKTIADLDAQHSLRGRIEREQWVEQAKALAESGKVEK